MLIYIDTNVYLDYMGNREDNLKPLGEFAFQLIQRALKCEFEILLSDLVLEELNRHASKKEIERMLCPLLKKNKIQQVVSTKEDSEEAKEECIRCPDIHFSDSLHYAIALRCCAEAIITNDKHFYSIESPELLITTPNRI